MIDKAKEFTISRVFKLKKIRTEKTTIFIFKRRSIEDSIQLWVARRLTKSVIFLRLNVRKKGRNTVRKGELW